MINQKLLQIDLSKLGNAVQNEVATKTEYNESVKKVDAIKTIESRNLVQFQ